MQTETEQSATPVKKRATRKPNPDLTPFEFQVLVYMANGYSNNEIALMLYVSIYTVECHRKGMLRKMAAKNSTHAITLAFRKKIID